jgi:TolB-like protein
MIPDLFISYSRKNTKQATELAELLRQDGHGVWLDQHALEGASNWSQEITEAIWGCSALIVLISRDSIESVNVAREVTIAAERGKPILPIDIDHVELPSSLAYPLAGVQRLIFGQQDAVVRALKKLGVEAGMEPHPTIRQLKFTPIPPDPLGRKALAVLPFENLSSDAEDAWFADGLTQEIINVLAHIKSLRVKDRRSVMNYDPKGKAVDRIGDELGVEYLLEGTIRKHGPTLRAMAELIDIHSQEHIWNNTFKGSAEDMFATQEQFALDMADALKISLSAEERPNIAKRSTENLAALELLIKAEAQLVDHLTRSDYQKVLEYADAALRLDRNIAPAWFIRARALNGLVAYHGYPPVTCTEARESALLALANDAQSARAFAELGFSYALQGKAEDCFDAIKQALAIGGDYYVHMRYGTILLSSGKLPEALQQFELGSQLDPENVINAGLMMIAAFMTEKDEILRRVSTNIKPYFERRAAIEPENILLLCMFAAVLHYSGEHHAALEISERFLHQTSYDNLGTAHVIVALNMLGKIDDAIAFASTATDFSVAKRYIAGPGFAPFRAHPGYAALRERFEGTTAT